MTAQPICVIYLPENFSIYKSGRQMDPGEMMDVLNGRDKTCEDFGKPLGGYLWFVFPKPGIAAPELQTFYEKDMKEITWEEIKAELEKQGKECA